MAIVPIFQDITKQLEESTSALISPNL